MKQASPPPRSSGTLTTAVPLKTSKHDTSHVLWQRELQAVSATPEQRNQLRLLMRQAREDVRRHSKTIRALRRDLARVRGVPHDGDQATEAARRMILTQMEGINQRVQQARLQLASLLTPEQRNKLQRLECQQAAQGPGLGRKSRVAPGLNAGRLQAFTATPVAPMNSPV